MFKTNLLSHVDLNSMMNATNLGNVMDDSHIQAVLNLLVTKNTPPILSQKDLADKINRMRFGPDVSYVQKAEIKKILLDLSHLPTGKRLLSLLPEAVFFTAYSDENNAYFSRKNFNINIDLSEPRSPAERCADAAHEIRHVIQFKYDPTFMDFARTSYPFEKMVELDCCLQNRKVEREYLDILDPNNDVMRRAHERKNPEYYKYFYMLQNNPELSDEEKEQLNNTLHAIDVWYGISSNSWRNVYDENAKKLEGFTRTPNAPYTHPIDRRLSELDKYIRQSYIQNMGVSLSPDFFDSSKDCTIYFKGHKIFERKSTAFDSNVTVFSLTGQPMYQSELDCKDKKRNETYFYPSGLKEAFYNYQGNGTRTGEYIRYYETQRIKEKGLFSYDPKRSRNRGIGYIFADSDIQTIIGKSTYYQSGQLEIQYFTAGENSGQYVHFHDGLAHNIYLKAQTNGNGHFEIYRDDARNSLKWSGEQKAHQWDGECIQYDPNGNVVQRVIYSMGKKIGTSTNNDKSQIKQPPSGVPVSTQDTVSQTAASQKSAEEPKWNSTFLRELLSKIIPPIK